MVPALQLTLIVAVFIMWEPAPAGDSMPEYDGGAVRLETNSIPFPF